MCGMWYPVTADGTVIGVQLLPPLLDLRKTDPRPAALA